MRAQPGNAEPAEWAEPWGVDTGGFGEVTLLVSLPWGRRQGAHSCSSNVCGSGAHTGTLPGPPTRPASPGCRLCEDRGPPGVLKDGPPTSSLGSGWVKSLLAKLCWGTEQVGVLSKCTRLLSDRAISSKGHAVNHCTPGFQLRPESCTCGSRIPKLPRGIGAGSRHHTDSTWKH